MNSPNFTHDFRTAAKKPGFIGRLAVWHCLTSAVLVFFATNASATGQPVFDFANFGKMVALIEEAGRQTKALGEQIEQYKTIQGALGAVAGDAGKLHDVLKTFQSVRDSAGEAFHAYDQLMDLKTRYGSIEGLKREFLNASDYNKIACIRNMTCSRADIDAMLGAHRALSTEQKAANTVQLKALRRQQEALHAEEKRLDQMAQSADSTNQKTLMTSVANAAMLENEQLMRLRELIVADQRATLAWRQSQQDDAARKEAVEKAAGEYYFAPSSPTPKRCWDLRGQVSC